jgi:hypothetical protein
MPHYASSTYSCPNENCTKHWCFTEIEFFSLTQLIRKREGCFSLFRFNRSIAVFEMTFMSLPLSMITFSALSPCSNRVWKILVRSHSWFAWSSFLFPDNTQRITQLGSSEAPRCSSSSCVDYVASPSLASFIIVNSFSHIKSSFLSLVGHTTS